LIPSISLGETEGPPGRLLYKGAEADVFLGTWAGIPAVYKIRKKMEYRLDALDSVLRTQRTIHEANMLASAKAAGVEAPFVYFLSPGRATLVMEYIAGTRMKDAIADGETRETTGLFRKLGSSVARLHGAGIMHGDLTTANVIVRSGSLVFLDFGLSVHSTRVEDHAVDMRLIKETITGAHAPVAGVAIEALFEGYREVSGDEGAKSVLRQLKAIERRGRYARVE